MPPCISPDFGLSDGVHPVRKVGLAEAAVEIMNTDVIGIIRWFEFCLIQYGIDPDARIEALRDALAREVMSQMDAMEAMEDDEEES